MGARLSDEELGRRLEIYRKQSEGESDPSQPSYLEAIERLVQAGCDPEILLGLARAHCLSPIKRSANFLSPELTKFADSLDRANKDFWALVDEIGSSFGNSAGQIVEMMKLESLIPLFASKEWFRHLAELRVQILDRIRIYEALLCVYVRQVTGKDDYAALAAIYRAFYWAGGMAPRKKGEVSQDAPRMADVRYRREHPEAYAALEAAVTSYLNIVAAGAIGQRAPHYVLLVLAHIEMGNLLEHPSSEAKPVSYLMAWVARNHSP